MYGIGWEYWVGFHVLIFLLLALDLGVLHKKDKVLSAREALGWSAFWIALALGFNYFILQWRGPQAGAEFLAGYLIEKALSVDNLFVFLILFQFFKVPNQYYHKVLYWGIIGALIMRALFIWAGIELIHHFHFVIYVFGAFLVYTGYKIAFSHSEEDSTKESGIIRLVRRLVPTTTRYHGSQFFVRLRGRRYATPLLLVLIAVESTDVVFAVDSIPAILSITDDPFIVYTSNVFAILGLRSLFFALSAVVSYFKYLKYGLALILVFVGLKMLAADYVKDVITPFISLSVVVTLLAGSMVVSWLVVRREQRNAHAALVQQKPAVVPGVSQ